MKKILSILLLSLCLILLLISFNACKKTKIEMCFADSKNVKSDVLEKEKEKMINEAKTDGEKKTIEELFNL